MSKKMLFAALALSAHTAMAANISGFGAPTSNPALAGGTSIDFQAAAVGGYTNLAIGGVTLTNGGGAGFEVTSNNYGGYNATGNNLQNGTQGTTVFNFAFDNVVSAFGFNFGASNEDWLLQAFDAASNVVGSYLLPQTWFSDSGDYFGIAAAGIVRASLTQLTHNVDSNADHILLDNFSYLADAGAEVPEPSVLALLGLALCIGVGQRRLSRR